MTNGDTFKGVRHGNMIEDVDLVTRMRVSVMILGNEI